MKTRYWLLLVLTLLSFGAWARVLILLFIYFLVTWNRHYLHKYALTEGFMYKYQNNFPSPTPFCPV